MKKNFLIFLGFTLMNLVSAQETRLTSSQQPILSLQENKLVDASPESVGVDSALLYLNIDRIMKQALDSAAFPGGVVFLAKDGKVFFEKAYGYHTYTQNRKVEVSDIYDLASVTKTTGATLALMKLYEDGQFDLEKTMGDYWPKIAKRGKQDLVMRDVLAHQAGLKAWIPYWSESQRKSGKYRWNTVKYDSSRRFPYKISKSGLWMHKDFKEKKIYRMIKKTKVSEDKTYLYSGLPFYLIPEYVERVSGKPFNEYLRDEFYTSLNAYTLGFKAGERFPLDRIVPTEVDSFFRMETLHGVVHDEGAAMMLGVSGNAGLFSNARDLAKVYQMLLNDGYYDGRRYLKPETIKEFTKVQFPENDNRRGLGFDKPLLIYDIDASSVARDASPASFGHSGYTGTLVWADPENDLLFIFLSNRVHPTRDNRKLYTLGVRPAIHNAVYELLKANKGTYSIGYRGED